jgi:hypothetical protein
LGNEWFAMLCSDEYWDAVAPIFERLKAEKDNGKNGLKLKIHSIVVSNGLFI